MEVFYYMFLTKQNQFRYIYLRDTVVQIFSISNRIQSQYHNSQSTSLEPTSTAHKQHTVLAHSVPAVSCNGTCQRSTYPHTLRSAIFFQCHYTIISVSFPTLSCLSLLEQQFPNFHFASHLKRYNLRNHHKYF